MRRRNEDRELNTQMRAVCVTLLEVPYLHKLFIRWMPFNQVLSLQGL